MFKTSILGHRPTLELEEEFLTYSAQQLVPCFGQPLEFSPLQESNARASWLILVSSGLARMSRQCVSQCDIHL